MMPLTSQERRLICFVAVAASVGWAVSALRAAAPVDQPLPFDSPPPAWTAAAQAVAPVSNLPINSATVSELVRLPGVGPVTAERIVRYREAHGPFRAVEDLLQVKGIGPKTLARFRELVVVGSPLPETSETSETSKTSDKLQVISSK